MENFDVNAQAKLSGVITALSTPYKGGKIDEKSFVKLLEYQKKAGVKSILVGGTTGEGAFLTPEEKRLLLSLAKYIFSKQTVIAGIGGSTTKDVAIQAIFAENNGADVLLVAPPSFSKCTEAGFVGHISHIAKVTKLPLILYNVPQRCGYVLPLSCVKKCVKKGVVALKDADTCALYSQKARKFVNVICGADNRILTENFSSVISVASNVAPMLTQSVLLKCATTQQQNAFSALCKYCFCEVSPVPIKYLLARLSVFENCSMRLPLTKASSATQKRAEKLLDDYGDLLK